MLREACPLERAFFLRARVASRGTDSPRAEQTRQPLARVSTRWRISPRAGEGRQELASLATSWRGSPAAGEGCYALGRVICNGRGSSSLCQSRGLNAQPPRRLHPGPALKPRNDLLRLVFGVGPKDAPDLLDRRAALAEEGADDFVPRYDDAVGLEGGFEEVGVFFDGSSGGVRGCGLRQAGSELFVTSQVFRRHDLPAGMHAVQPLSGVVRAMPLPFVKAVLAEHHFMTKRQNGLKRLPAPDGRSMRGRLPTSGPGDGGVNYDPLTLGHSSSSWRRPSLL